MKHDNAPTHYIGIGASAGGLEALQLLLENLPADTNACFVVVQHLSPDFKSMMLELLAKYTGMHIENVVDGTRARANTIYLIPPKKNMVVSEGVLLLSDKVVDGGLNLPIDVFLKSLADDQDHHAIGIILSGTGSDGSRGIKCVKEAGGLVIAQTPNSAKFDGMPINAINTGVVDKILSPEEMGAALANYISHPIMSGKLPKLSDTIAASEGVINQIFNLLKNKSGVDFSKYKHKTIARRIERRMVVSHTISLHEYHALLITDDAELTTLEKELLIGVTRFFRDTDAFTALANGPIAELVRNCKSRDVIRVWVSACSTGEEAYSIAILINEELRKQQVSKEVKIFATDLNPDSISFASNGVYRKDSIVDVPKELLDIYFAESPKGEYQVSQVVRNMVVFATHNMIVDPPFSNMDLVTCRNVLIYFKPIAQKKVLSSFHFALKNAGYLFLGQSENLGDLSPYFNTFSESKKIYAKVPNSRISSAEQMGSLSEKRVKRSSVPTVDSLMKSYKGNNGGRAAVGFVNEMLISTMISPTIILNDQKQAIHVHGDVSNYIKRLPPGRISIEITDMVNEDISSAISAALQKCEQESKDVIYTGLQTSSQGQTLHLNVRTRYVKEHDIANAPGFYWVIFESVTDTENVEPIRFDVSDDARRRIQELESQLKASNENLQVTVEELETSNEELQSANEELMSANEELQSTNEELQSVNEELYSVNSEHQEKIAEISQVNNDLDEILGLSKIGIIFLDDELKIRRYTAAASKYINLLPTDITRPLHHLSKVISYDNMTRDVAGVFATGQPFDIELAFGNEQLVRISINKYKYNDFARSTGVAITFSDISQVKFMELGMSVAFKELRQSVNNALDLLDSAPFDNPINVLLIESDKAFLDLLTDKVGDIASFPVNIKNAASIKEANTILSKQHIDVCIVGFDLNEETALDFIITAKEGNLGMPVIVITDSSKGAHYPVLLAHGALDILDKDELSTLLLDSSIRYAVRRNQIDKELSSQH